MLFPCFWSPKTARNSLRGGITAPFARYGTVGTRGKVALNPMVFEPNGVGTFQGPNENADSTALITPFTLLMAPFTTLMILFRTDLIASLIPLNTLTTVFLADVNLSTIAFLILSAKPLTVDHIAFHF